MTADPAEPWGSLRSALATRAPRRDLPEGVPQAAVAALLVPAGGDFELLLIRRAERAGDPWSGHMALPGGRREERDRDLLETVLREVREEVGVALDPELRLGELDDLRPVTAPARVIVRPFVFALPRRPDLVTSVEVAQPIWTSLRELAGSASTIDVVHRGALRTMPCYRAGEHVVWGMTHRILEPFLALAAAGRGPSG
jgi:8-oxo-dGTP pyrophosphatase MutT (NUDIX family)